jgi:putative endonuclease
MFLVFALTGLERNYIYVGLSGTIERRIFEHISGKNNTTKSYRPFAFIYLF